MGATAVQRELLRRAGTRLIDWEAVRRIARRRLGAEGAGLSEADRSAAEAFYQAELLRIEPIVAESIGAELPRALETPAVVDRFEWIDLNLATFEQLFGRVERIINDATIACSTAGRAAPKTVAATALKVATSPVVTIRFRPASASAVRMPSASRRSSAASAVVNAESTTATCGPATCSITGRSSG